MIHRLYWKVLDLLIHINVKESVRRIRAISVIFILLIIGFWIGYGRTAWIQGTQLSRTVWILTGMLVVILLALALGGKYLERFLTRLAARATAEVSKRVIEKEAQHIEHEVETAAKEVESELDKFFKVRPFNPTESSEQKKKPIKPKKG